MNCPYCGGEVPEGAVYCGSCGRPLPGMAAPDYAQTGWAAAQPAPQKHRKKGPGKLIAALAAVVLIAGGIWLAPQILRSRINTPPLDPPTRPASSSAAGSNSMVAVTPDAGPATDTAPSANPVADVDTAGSDSTAVVISDADPTGDGSPTVGDDPTEGGQLDIAGIYKGTETSRFSDGKTDTYDGAIAYIGFVDGVYKYGDITLEYDAAADAWRGTGVYPDIYETVPVELKFTKNPDGSIHLSGTVRYEWEENEWGPAGYGIFTREMDSVSPDEYDAYIGFGETTNPEASG